MLSSLAKGRAALLASTVLIACGGAGGGDGPSAVVPPDYTGLPTTNLPDSRLLDVPLRAGYGPFCYVQSLSMALAYLDPTSTEAEAFTFAGFGASVAYGTPYGSFVGGFVPGPGKGTDFHHRTLLQNYGARFVIGSGGGFGGYWSQYGAEFLGAAIGKIGLQTSADALTHLKAAVASGRPVQVHLDMNRLPTYCRAVSEHPEACDGSTGPSSHYVIVTGYDPSSIFINDAVAPARDPRFKDMKLPVAEFMDAWEKTKELGPYGPYWMLFIEPTSGADLSKRSAAQVLAMQKSLSGNVAAEIDDHAGSEISGTSWIDIATVRRLFSDYLVSHGHTEAGALYQSLAQDYDQCRTKTASEARATLTGVIRAKEIEARSKL